MKIGDETIKILIEMPICEKIKPLIEFELKNDDVENFLKTINQFIISGKYENENTKGDN